MSKLPLLSFLLLALLSWAACGEDDEAATRPTTGPEAFLGTYQANETCGSFTQSYTVTIARGAGDDGIVLRNLDDTDNVAATVSESTFEISTQFFDSGSYRGTGRRNGETVIVEYNKRRSVFEAKDCRVVLRLR